MRNVKLAFKFSVSQVTKIILFFISSGKQDIRLLCDVTNCEPVAVSCAVVGRRYSGQIVWNDNRGLFSSLDNWLTNVSGRHSGLISRVVMPFFSDISILEGETTVSSRNVGNQLPSVAASRLRRKDFSYVVEKA
jgi:hypothetical protein